ncbi:HEPN domain-containing protein [Ferrovum sp.]|uniref:HEPN domain-containing protein n=1 Tax=Ferrovum sp. TaxID=2609467 RepID=UPI00262E2510|nr:HEPN domain-containing protein [Ferrovum sp.]
MPYRISRARRGLQAVYLDINARLLSAYSSRIDPKIRDYVIAASIFLAHAELENYIADIFSEFAFAAQAIATKGSQLPGELQSHLFLSKANAKTVFSKYVGGNSEKELLKSFMVALRGHAGTIVNDSVAMASFEGKDIYAGEKYPSVDNLKKLFYRIGIDNVFNKLNGYLKQDSEALLKSLGSFRTQLAHTGNIPPEASCKDIRDLLRNTERFVGAIDRLMYKSISSNFSSSVWVFGKL